ncbi:NAD(P)H-hydrate dehydratase, partial [Mariprofundus ferrooxydans]|nr:NAD(P)H-hydrate dehydratase [Mariprofundus ferrooxydans]
LKSRNVLTVLTPHAGEAGRLLGKAPSDIQKDRLTSALALVDKYQAWIVLKGAQTLIVSPQKHVWLNPFGSVNLATAGTGDVLAGVMGGLLAGGVSPDIAIPAAVALHGLAGEQQGWYRAGQLEALIASQVQRLRER